MQPVIANTGFRTQRCLHMPGSLRQSRCRIQVRAVSEKPGFLQRIGRVLQEKAQSDLDRFVKGTDKTRERLGLVEELFTLWSLDDYEDTLEELEDALICADFGPKTALGVVDQLRKGIKAGKLKTGADIRTALKQNLVSLLLNKGGSTELKFDSNKPGVILVVGVNGSGKTTTIGKLANKFTNEGASVMLAAGDTFRAAAAEQLSAWAQRSNAVMGPYREGQRPDTVLYKSLDQAVKDGVDVVICDTSGRLHTNWNLMEELAKCKRTLTKRMDSAPHEVLLVLDGTTGLNMLNQAREFHETVGLTGLILTKLDGSARGGAVVSVVDELNVPVKFVGVGETVDDLQPFAPESFVEALFPSLQTAQ